MKTHYKEEEQHGSKTKINGKHHWRNKKLSKKDLFLQQNRLNPDERKQDTITPHLTTGVHLEAAKIITVKTNHGRAGGWGCAAGLLP
ncbi:hypothetical protein Q8G39_28160, partial [Klebsiella pneumoniae]|uniref:hypothetical protein n=1 Tax=Klebsiella pneumoniae TaxID=573 RepID=UPI00301329A7